MDAIKELPKAEELAIFSKEANLKRKIERFNRVIDDMLASAAGGATHSLCDIYDNEEEITKFLTDRGYTVEKVLSGIYFTHKISW